MRDRSDDQKIAGADVYQAQAIGDRRRWYYLFTRHNIAYSLSILTHRFIRTSTNVTAERAFEILRVDGSIIDDGIDADLNQIMGSMHGGTRQMQARLGHHGDIPTYHRVARLRLLY